MTNFTVAICECFEAEFTAVLDRFGHSGISLVVMPARCERGYSCWDDFLNEAARARPDVAGQPVSVLCGGCAARIAGPPRAAAGSSIHRFGQCVDLLAGSTLTASLAESGAFLLSPGWLARWPRTLREWGFSQEDARAFFAESTRRLVLLDSGLDPAAAANLATLADFLDLPAERLCVGLDHLSLFVEKLALAAEREAERSQHAAALSATRQRSADSAMALDLASSLARVDSESEVIDRIVEFFTSLTAPRQLAYAAVENGRIISRRASPEGAAVGTEDEIVRRIRGRRTSGTICESDACGLRLWIDHQGETLGLLEMTEIAFPAHLDRYVNAALAVGDICGLAISSARASEQLSVSRAVAETERERLLIAIQSSGDGFITTDEVGRIELMNPVAEQLTGWLQTEAAGHPLSAVLRLLDEATRAPSECPCARALLGGKVVTLEEPTLLVARDGSERSIADSCAPIRDRSGRITGSVLIFSDVTEQRRVQTRIAFEAMHDPLTGLTNRRGFDAALRETVRRTAAGASSTLLYIDVDHFKEINDTLGHEAGDRALLELAKRIQSQLRAVDTLARLGGDEFAIILRDTSGAKSLAVAERIQSAARLADVELPITSPALSLSIGLAPIDARVGTDVALRSADAAMYNAKKTGRGRTVVYEESLAPAAWDAASDHAAIVLA